LNGRTAHFDVVHTSRGDEVRVHAGDDTSTLVVTLR
jgi:hypothetical protein